MRPPAPFGHRPQASLSSLAPARPACVGYGGRAQGFFFSPSPGDCAPALATLGVRPPTRPPLPARRSVFPGAHPFSVWSSLPLDFIAIRLSLSALPRVLLVYLRPSTCPVGQGRHCARRQGPHFPWLHVGRGPNSPPSFPRLPSVAPRYARLRGERCPLRSLLFFRLRSPFSSAGVHTAHCLPSGNHHLLPAYVVADCVRHTWGGSLYGGMIVQRLRGLVSSSTSACPRKPCTIISYRDTDSRLSHVSLPQR